MSVGNCKGSVFGNRACITEYFPCIESGIGDCNLACFIHCVKCPNAELFLIIISCIRTEYGHLLRIQSKYRKIRTRNISAFGHFSRSDRFSLLHIDLVEVKHLTRYF